MILTQLRAKVEETTDAAVTEGLKNMQAAVNTQYEYELPRAGKESR